MNAASDPGTLFKKDDVLVLFGELFGRGYASGVVEAAKRAGMQLIGVTVGRRDENNQLRALTAEELATAEAGLGGKIINVPMMAGFDLDAPEGQPTPTDLLNEMTIDTWQEHKLDWDYIAQCREIGTARFKAAVTEAMTQIDALIPSGKNVIFLHTMAGGIPKAKVFLVLANRIYKGRGARHMKSQDLLDSDLGKFILQNFDEVSANTFDHLLQASAPIRSRIEAAGGEVRYGAYGYHGTKVLIDGEYRWQTYTNYTQGYAKMRLEDFAKAAWAGGVKATVFNCPEIRTNSSDVFAGIELSLLPLLSALQREGAGSFTDAIWTQSAALLKEGISVQDMLDRVSAYQASEAMQPYYDFAAWPKPNSADQVEQTVGTSQDVLQMHRDPKALISDLLSQHVVSATGALIFDKLAAPTAPVEWLNHDEVARQLAEDKA